MTTKASMSKPYLTFHHIASIQFGPVRDFVRGDPCLTGDPFATRTLVLTQADGTTYRFSLYAASVEQLQVGVDTTIDRHSADSADRAAAKRLMDAKVAIAKADQTP